MKAAHLAIMISAAAPIACSPEELHRDVFVLEETGGPAAWEAPASVNFYLHRDDLNINGRFQDQPAYRLRFDGLDVVWDTGEYVGIGAGSFISGLRFPVGDHLLEVVSDDASLPPAATNVSLASLQVHHMVVFGDPHAPQHRFFRDDLATVPAGMTHLRLLNGLDDGQRITPARCADSGLPCVAVGAPLAFGELFEIDEPTETRQQLMWRLTDGDASVSGPMASGLHPRLAALPTGELSPFMLTVPLHINASGSTSSHAW
jgi:hypothetical protein